MSNVERYKPLLDLSLAIARCNQELQDWPAWRRRSELRATIAQLETRYTQVCVTLVGNLIGSFATRSDLTQFLQTELTAIRTEADPGWHDAIDQAYRFLSDLVIAEEAETPIRCGEK